MCKVLDFNEGKCKRDAEKNAFKVRQWGDSYMVALEFGFDMEQAMDVADRVTEDMWSEGLGGNKK